MRTWFMRLLFVNWLTELLLPVLPFRFTRWWMGKTAKELSRGIKPLPPP